MMHKLERVTVTFDIVFTGAIVIFSADVTTDPLESVEFTSAVAWSKSLDVLNDKNSQ
jgi:hypothetical protein